MSDCPFCLLIAKGTASFVTPNVVTFEPLNPVTEGHRLFVPTQHWEHSDVGSQWPVAECMGEAQRFGQTAGEEYNLIISNGRAATQSIPHLHVHYVPRRFGDELPLPWTGQKR